MGLRDTNNLKTMQKLIRVFRPQGAVLTMSCQVMQPELPSSFNSDRHTESVHFKDSGHIADQVNFSLPWRIQTIKSFIGPWGLGGKLGPKGRSIQIDSSQTKPRVLRCSLSSTVFCIQVSLPSLISPCLKMIYVRYWLWGNLRIAKFTLFPPYCTAWSVTFVFFFFFKGSLLSPVTWAKLQNTQWTMCTKQRP